MEERKEEEGAKKINVKRRALQPEIKGEPQDLPRCSSLGLAPRRSILQGLAVRRAPTLFPFFNPMETGVNHNPHNGPHPGLS